MRSIWFHPSETIARIAHSNPGYGLFVLPILAGFAQWPTILLSVDETNILSVGLFWSALLSFGPVIEVVQVFVGAYLIQVTGRWLGGKAGVSSIQAAIAWGNVPIAVLAILGIPFTIVSFVLKEGLDVDLLEEPTPAIAALGFTLAFVVILSVSWSLVIFIRSLATVQNFSTTRAIVNSVIAWLLPIVVVSLVLVTLRQGDTVIAMLFGGLDTNAIFHTE